MLLLSAREMSTAGVPCEAEGFFTLLPCIPTYAIPSLDFSGTVRPGSFFSALLRLFIVETTLLDILYQPTAQCLMQHVCVCVCGVQWLLVVDASFDGGRWPKWNIPYLAARECVAGGSQQGPITVFFFFF